MSASESQEENSVVSALDGMFPVEGDMAQPLIPGAQSDAENLEDLAGDENQSINRQVHGIAFRNTLPNIAPPGASVPLAQQPQFVVEVMPDPAPEAHNEINQNVAPPGNAPARPGANVYFTRTRVHKLLHLVALRQRMGVFKLILTLILIGFNVYAFYLLPKFVRGSRQQYDTFILLLLYTLKDILILILNIYAIWFMRAQKLALTRAMSMSLDDFPLAMGVSAYALGLHPDLHGLDNRLNMRGVDLPLSKPELALELRRELRFLHSQNKLYVALTYLHYPFNVFLFVFSLAQHPYMLSVVYVQITLIGTTTLMPLSILAFFYATMFIVGAFLLAFEGVGMILLFVTLFVFSPCICLYLKCSDKNDEGLTNFEVRVRESLVAEECSICLENYGLSDRLVQFPCHPMHRFHENCGKDWWRTKKSCPLCRQNLQNYTEDQLRSYANEEMVYNQNDVNKKAKKIPIIVLFGRYVHRKFKKQFLKCVVHLDSVANMGRSLTLLLLLVI